MNESIEIIPHLYTAVTKRRFDGFLLTTIVLRGGDWGWGAKISGNGNHGDMCGSGATPEIAIGALVECMREKARAELMSHAERIGELSKFATAGSDR